MKKFWLAIALTIGAMSSAQAMDFREGVHYEIVSEERTEKTEILDFFSFYCNACYQFQPFSNMLAEEFGDNFKKYHVDFVGPQGMGETIVQAWATASILDVKSELAPAVFRQHFAQRNISNSKDDLKTIFASIGVDGDEFERAYNSFPARSLTNRMRREAQKYDVRATPTFIVNGRYRMMSSGFRDSNNFFDDYLALAKYLVEKDS
ncbi:disulfide isomerase [Aliidiomarina minuta]|uniref:Thiol:disulfide interchange protein n=1 Tax=Aliidiomarina minuta TaxID=880057 RepID=A0A432WAI4_9GAMM|nr:thiol:disulfide interchange protein DsbA/DsbL [Aliidiomarina minuta]RUO27051.1 disulfide isomerase [Aliidiomarina minuta]